MSDSLIALANGAVMGEVLLQGERLSFQYDTIWQSRAEAFPLSLSMPLISSEHGHRLVDAFLWGLLPDNEGVLERWGRRFQISSRNPFRLLQHVGEDCAGAVQFVLPERVDQLLAKGTKPSVSWLSTGELSQRIISVVTDASATRLGSDNGQFSLAGAQPKIALYFDAKTSRWGVPEGRTPTTHILKPANGAFDGQIENEHFCLRLASELGFPTAHSRVMHCGDIPVIVLDRYDRLEKGGVMQRIHQEDFCQAAGIRPQLKYQNQGGPSPKVIGEILRTFSTSPDEDITRFAESLIFNWLTGGTDAHAKNYSVLIAGHDQARLSPLYDLASALPYPQQVQPRKAAMAMKVGSHYKIRDVRRRDWEKLSLELRLPRAEVLDRIARMATRLPDAAEIVAKSIKKEGVEHPVIDRIVQDLTSHTKECMKSLLKKDAL